MQVINESQFPERDAQIIAAIEEKSTKEVAEQFKLSVGTIRKIVRRAKASQVYDLNITDGQQSVQVCQIITSRGFVHACRRAMREYSAFFARLELPQWRLVAGGESISLNSEELAG